MTSITITHYTDPGCPFAWSAEPARRRLQWLYGDQLEWKLRMVGLTERPQDYTDQGFTPERQSSSFAESWLAEPETGVLLKEDLAQARTPTPAALALAHRLAPTGDGGYRYTCPSYELVASSDGASLSAPGFQPTLTYEVAIANLAPELIRREDPESVAEVLEWAGEPLATAEVAAVCGIELGEAREQLGRVAAEEHIGSDGLWALEPVIA